MIAALVYIYLCTSAATLIYLAVCFAILILPVHHQNQ
jgi:hypothetical protein